MLQLFHQLRNAHKETKRFVFIATFIGVLLIVSTAFAYLRLFV